MYFEIRKKKKKKDWGEHSGQAGGQRKDQGGSSGTKVEDAGKVLLTGSTM